MQLGVAQGGLLAPTRALRATPAAREPSPVDSMREP